MWYKLVMNNYIMAVSRINIGESISDDEYNSIMTALKNIPETKETIIPKLRNDTLEWELVEIPETPEELDAETALKKLSSMLTKTQMEKVSKDEDLYNYLQKMEMIK